MNTFIKKKTLKIKNKIITLNSPKVMGILNLTPDSFFDGNRYKDMSSILARVEEMLKEGADFIDIGGYSTRPGATEVSPGEEIDRVEAPIHKIAESFPEAILSIDTFRAAVAKRALQAGADMINDISAGDDDSEMIDLVAEENVPYILMHKQGKPKNMQENPEYEDVVEDLISYFSEKIQILNRKGIHDLIIDPGFGFGKTVEHNYQLLQKLDLFRIFELPVMAGLSRKSMINKVLEIKPGEALNGTTVLNTLALLNGVDILRVHDIREAKETIKLLTLYQQTE